MEKRLRINLEEPVLVMGYDWERYGKWDDESRNRQDREDSRRGIRAIIKAHEDHEAPLTLFTLGKLLEVPELKEVAHEISRSYSPEFVDFEQHTYSHIMIKTNILRGKGSPLEEVQADLIRGKKAIENLTGMPVVGLGSAQSFFRGLLDEPERQQTVVDADIQFIRSDGRGPGDTRPAPSYDETGAYRGPYFYAGTPELLEIPAHGYSDNYLKGFSKEKPQEPWSVELEIESHLDFFSRAIDSRSHFSPLIHEWSLARVDPDANVVRAILEEANKQGVEIVTFAEINRRIRESML